MGRKPKPISVPKLNTLLEALKFLSLITKDEGNLNETHIYLGSHWAIANNGILAAACKIDEDLYACPHNQTLIQALSKCGNEFSITQLGGISASLSVKSNKFKAVVPCIDPTLFNVTGPDDSRADISDELKKAFEIVLAIPTNEKEDRIIAISILISGQSVIATNGQMLFEYWHGIDLPPSLPIPKLLAEAIVKTPKKLARLGFSHNSVTFYFEDESWIKSQLFSTGWPDVSGILDCETNLEPLPNEFFNGLEAVAPFTERFVYFHDGSIGSHSEVNIGASYELPGLTTGPIFQAKQLAMIKQHAQKIDFNVEGKNGCPMLIFYGDRIRGVVTGVKE